MSNYTTQLRYIIENYVNDETLSLSQIIEKGRKVIFDFNYPLSSKYRAEFEKNFIRHFYTREIGSETVALFKLRLEDRLNLISKYYDKLLQSEEIKYDIFNDTALEEKFTSEFNETEEHSSNFLKNRGSEFSNQSDSNVDITSSSTLSESKNENGNSSKNLESTTINSDYPQASFINNKDYASSASNNENTESSNFKNNGSTDSDSSSTEKNVSTGNNSGSETEKETNSSDSNISKENSNSYLKTLKGKSSGVSNNELLAQYRKNILKIELDLISELEDLFMLIY